MASTSGYDIDPLHMIILTFIVILATTVLRYCESTRDDADAQQAGSEAAGGADAGIVKVKELDDVQKRLHYGLPSKYGKRMITLTANEVSFVADCDTL